MKKWLNCELENHEADLFREYLRNNKIHFESSGCFNLVHFEIYVDEEQATSAQAFLDTL